MTHTFAPFRYPHLFTLWQDWQTTGQGHQLDKWLKSWFKSHKQYGKRDRQAYSDAMFAAMRYLQLTCALDDSYPNKPQDNWQTWDTHWQHTAHQTIKPAAFWYWVLLRIDENTPPPRELNDANERKAHFTSFKQHALHKTQTPEYLLLHGFRPQWLNALHKRQESSDWGEQTLHKFIEQHSTQSPLWLRPQHKTAIDVRQLLHNEGIETEIHNNSLCVYGQANVLNSQCYQNGWVEIQDLASQQLAASVTPKTGDSIWDVCAGAGGKTLAIANTLDNSNTLIASDNREHALKTLQKRAARAGFTNIETTTADISQGFTPPPHIQQQGGFNWVFIDAPCSSSGTWRRSPDARWRLDTLNELLSLQQAILCTAAKQVKAGGILVYATCSWLHQENEAQIRLFLNKHPEFVLTHQQCIGNPEQDSDTMFYGLLEKQN